MRRYLVAALLIGWTVTIAYFFIQKNNSDKRLYREKRVLMGTFVEVVSPRKEAIRIAFEEIARIEKLLSKYNPESEVYRLNKTGTLKVSPETFYIIQRSKEFYHLSNGAFDITIAPLMDLWGFTNGDYNTPSETKIKNALKLVGSDKIILHQSSFVIQFIASGIKIDLGAIAKGYAIDCAVKKVRAYGIKDFLINAGGQVYCSGERFGKPWVVAIKNPRANELASYLELKNKAISTSGDYEQYFFKNKKRYAHIINPKTGYPAENSIASVTVIAEDGLTADALSTSIFILGKEKGGLIAQRLKAEIKIIEK
jgi:thiamine biosynthesis lipoprotein